MIWIRLFLTLIGVLALVYYLSLILHCFGVLRITKREITFKRILVPLYYWFAPEKEKPSKKKE